MHDMKSEVIKNIELMGFKPYGKYGAYRAFIKDVEYVVIEHPLKGLSMTATYISKRETGQIEIFLDRNSSMQDIAKSMLRLYNEFHPEKNNKI